MATGGADCCVRTHGELRSELLVRLQARRGEFQRAALTHLGTMCKSVDAGDAECVRGLREALSAALDVALVSIEEDGAWCGSLPPALAVEATRAARSGMSLDTLLRLCIAAQQQLVEFVVDEAADLPSGALRHTLRLLNLALDHVMALFTDEYRREIRCVKDSSGRRRAELVQHLLGGASVEASELDYALETWHLGVIASGPGAGKALRRVRLGVGFQLLSVLRDKETVWAWLGSARPLGATELEGAWAGSELERTSLALGEPGHGVEGWRLTHRQAQAAQWVALQRPGELTRYADQLLLVAALRDEVLASSLRETYLSPLKTRGECNGLATTLRAYFTSGCNAATAAAALRVDRHTVQRRLQRIEERLGRSIHDCRAELEVALRLEEFTQARNGGEPEMPPTEPEIATSLVGHPAH